MTFFFIDWIAMLTSMVAAYQIGNQQRRGFLLFMFSNAAWLVVGGMAHSPAIILGNLCFLLLNLRAYQRWTRALVRRVEPPLSTKGRP